MFEDFARGLPDVLQRHGHPFKEAWQHWKHSFPGDLLPSARQIFIIAAEHGWQFRGMDGMECLPFLYLPVHRKGGVGLEQRQKPSGEIDEFAVCSGIPHWQSPLSISHSASSQCRFQEGFFGAVRASRRCENRLEKKPFACYRVELADGGVSSGGFFPAKS